MPDTELSPSRPAAAGSREPPDTKPALSGRPGRSQSPVSGPRAGASERRTSWTEAIGREIAKGKPRPPAPARSVPAHAANSVGAAPEAGFRNPTQTAREMATAPESSPRRGPPNRAESSPGDWKPLTVAPPEPAAQHTSEAVAGEHREFDDPMAAHRRHPVRKKPTTLQRIQAILSDRRVVQIVPALIILVLFATNLGLFDSPWVAKYLQDAEQQLDAALTSVSRPIEDRAAFFIADDFELAGEGSPGASSPAESTWTSKLAGSGVAPPAGKIASGDMWLRQDTLRFTDYRLDFDARITAGAVGWMIRAQDYQNHYGFKLVESGNRGAKAFHLERFTLANGIRLPAENPVRLAVPQGLVRPGAFNRISVRVRDAQITTLVNGWGVDFWRDGRFERGGVGLFAGAGESAVVSRLTLTGKDDSWGLFLYGTVETIRSVRARISSPAAIMMAPSPMSRVVLVSPGGRKISFPLR